MNAPLSLYETVKEHILRQIADGTYKNGDKLPSENALVKTLGVSRMTVNRALRELSDQGHIIRRAGLGSFVSQRRMRGHAADIVSIQEELSERGETWSADVFSLEHRPASEELAALFQVKPHSPLIYLELVHYGDNTPVELETRWVNPVIAPDMPEQDFTAITPTDYLLHTAPLLKAEHVVRAVVPGTNDQEKLEIEAHTPCLEITRTTWSGDRIASHARLLYPGDRYELTARFSNVDATSILA